MPALVPTKSVFPSFEKDALNAAVVPEAKGKVSGLLPDTPNSQISTTPMALLLLSTPDPQSANLDPSGEKTA
jgi:hypothetical protein